MAEEISRNCGRGMAAAENLREIEAKTILTKSSSPYYDYAANPYVGCPYACRYCPATFMRRYTRHTEEWGEFLDVKTWPELEDIAKYDGKRIMIGSVTDPYNDYEAEYGRTRALLGQLKDTKASIMIATKSDLILWDLNLIKELQDVRVIWSVNILDEDVRRDMERAPSVERRLAAMRKLHDAGVEMISAIRPVLPGLTDLKAIVKLMKDYCRVIYFENLNLNGEHKAVMMDYIREKHPELWEIYDTIYNKHEDGYWHELAEGAESLAGELGLRYAIANEEMKTKDGPVLINGIRYRKSKRWTRREGSKLLEAKSEIAIPQPPEMQNEAVEEKPALPSAAELYNALLRIYGRPEWWGGNAFEVMFQAVLVQNTNWRGVEKVCAGLGCELTPENIAAIPVNDLADMIRPCRHSRAKAETVRTLLEWYKRYDYEEAKVREEPLVKLREELLALKGVGAETADVILVYGFDKASFIIDAYARRFLKQMGYKFKNDREIREWFEQGLPNEAVVYGNFHGLILAHSMQVCKKTPGCARCSLGNRCRRAGNGEKK